MRIRCDALEPMSPNPTPYPTSPAAAHRLMLCCESMAEVFETLRTWLPDESARIDAWEARIQAIPTDDRSVEGVINVASETLKVSGEISDWFHSMGVDTRAPEFGRIRDAHRTQATSRPKCSPVIRKGRSFGRFGGGARCCSARGSGKTMPGTWSAAGR